MLQMASLINGIKQSYKISFVTKKIKEEKEDAHSQRSRVRCS